MTSLSCLPMRALRTLRRSAVLMGSAVLVSAGPGPIHAAELWPMTRVRLTVIQWVPLEGVYQNWDAFTGEFLISEDGVLSLPAIGGITTRGKSSDQIASEVAEALQDRLGLVALPDAAVEIVSYPPIYVMGDVATPGSLEYRPGMTALQVYATSGGMRQEASGSTADRIRLVSDLRNLENDLVRARARIARLTAELAGAEVIEFPQEVADHSDGALAQSAMREEQSILAARSRELARQGEALDELVTLLQMEIDTLETRLVDVDAAIETAETELAGVQSLVASGIATVSRRSELERRVADLRFDRLTQSTAILRAQQAVSQARRESAQLEDARQTQGVLALQDEQAKLQQLLLEQATAQRLLLNLEIAPLAQSGQAQLLDYVIVRQGENGPTEIDADETSLLRPGDVLKVTAETSVVPSEAQ